MKQFLLLMAIVGLAATGCAQNRVLGTHARRGGADMKIARMQSKPRTNVTRSFQQKNDFSADSEIELASYGGGRCRGGACYEEPCYDDTCCGGDDCCGSGGCCDSGSGSGCSDKGGGILGRVRDGGGRFGLGLGSRDGSGGCSACGGLGCGLCQRLAGRIASGFCPHAGGYPEAYNFNPSPPGGQVAYPYYTVRGPRDFLRNNPPSIGPY